ncbi:MAG: hypothetical protein RLZ35_697 [Pseudomonadota bacterium]|jgi:hypothetical protein
MEQIPIKSPEQQKQAFMELEIRHLLQSGTDNPKINEHCFERIKKFINLPDNVSMSPISLGNAASMVDLGCMVYQLKKDIDFTQKRIDTLNKNIGLKNTEPSQAQTVSEDDKQKPRIG